LVVERSCRSGVPPGGGHLRAIWRGQLNIDRSTAYKAWQRTLKRLPKADVEALGKDLR
jgi:hypothetical protein